MTTNETITTTVPTTEEIPTEVAPVEVSSVAEEEEELVMCRICGQLLPASQMEEDAFGDFCCKECQDNGASVCDRCGRWTEQDELVSINNGDEFWCEDCADRHAYQCEDCHEYFTSSHMYHIGNIDICENCGENYYTCVECDNCVHQDNVYWSRRDEPLCEHCYNNEGGYNDVEDYCISYCTKPNPVFHGNSPLQMGFELETEECDGPICEQIRRFLDDDMIYFKQDGSLDDTGIEFITQPCDIDYYRNEYPLAKLLDTIEDCGGGESRDTGLHIHVNRVAFGDNKAECDRTIAKLFVIFAAHWDSILRFTRRDPYNTTYWKMPTFLMPKDLDENEIFDRVDNTNRSRYCAINNQNANTVEFRLFKATTDYVTLLATLQFVHNVVNYAKYHTITDILNSTFHEVAKYSDSGTELDTYLTRMQLGDIPAKTLQFDKEWEEAN